MQYCDWFFQRRYRRYKSSSPRYIDMKFIIILLISIFTLTSCNTVVGTAKGVGRDAKAVFIYSRDSITSRPISDE